MIIDTTQTKTESTLSNRLAVSGFCLSCKEYTIESMDDGGIRCYSCGAEMHLTFRMTVHKWPATKTGESDDN